MKLTQLVRSLYNQGQFYSHAPFEQLTEHPLIDSAMRRVSATVPIHWQISAAHSLQVIKTKILGQHNEPCFDEVDIPDVTTLALEDIDVSNPFLYQQNKWQPYFKRLRDECPVHYQAHSPFGAFWSITRYKDIMYVDKHHDLFSAEPIVTIGNQPDGLAVESFIAMDPPKHSKQRKAVQGLIAPKNLKQMQTLIRQRTVAILDALPTDRPFDWVEQVSIELTAMMLATMFDFPPAQYRKLSEWSDIVSSGATSTGGTVTSDQLFRSGAQMAKAFSTLWRVKAAKQAAGESLGFDFISMLLSNQDTHDMIDRPLEFMGNMVLLMVGGNGTTRNSMTGGVVAFDQFPAQFDKLKANPDLIPSAVSEIIRWQTPLMHMRRIAKEDVELQGKTIKKGDKVVMWYVSGNRDDTVIERPDQFIIDRKNANRHLSFGSGVHHCIGSHLAEMQMRILWEEIIKRFERIEVVNEPKYVQSNLVKGYTQLRVRVHPLLE